MLQKNKEKQERAAKRKPPIPYTRKTPTKKEREGSGAFNKSPITYSST